MAGKMVVDAPVERRLGRFGAGGKKRGADQRNSRELSPSIHLVMPSDMCRNESSALSVNKALTKITFVNLAS
jgi:hypothetical protein